VKAADAFNVMEKRPKSGDQFHCFRNFAHKYIQFCIENQ